MRKLVLALSVLFLATSCSNDDTPLEPCVTYRGKKVHVDIVKEVEIMYNRCDLCHEYGDYDRDMDAFLKKVLESGRGRMLMRKCQ